MSLTPAVLETQSDSQVAIFNTSSHPFHHDRLLTGVDPRADQGHKVLAIDESRLNEPASFLMENQEIRCGPLSRLGGLKEFLLVSKMTPPGVANTLHLRK